MKLFFINLCLLAICFSSCLHSFGPRDIDWQKEWNKNEMKLKGLAWDILTKGNDKYLAGNNEFPEGFKYPFDEGFYIETPFQNGSGQIIDPRKLTIKFYVDRGLLDHYSAFIFTNDSTRIKEFDQKVKEGAGDHNIEFNWYMIND
jgi:hypothetical protein